MSNNRFLARRPIESLQHHSNMQEQLVARVEATQKEADSILSRQPGFLGRLFPDEIQRAKAAHELTQAKTELEGRQRILHYIVETHVQAFKDACDVMLIQIKGPIRRALADFLAKQYILLQAEMERNEAEFQALIEKKYRRIQTITIAELREDQMNLMSKNIYEFHDLLDQMVHRYKSIVTEFINKVA